MRNNFRSLNCQNKMEESSWLKKRIIRWMEDNRGLILTVFGLPLSFIFDLVMQVQILFQFPPNYITVLSHPQVRNWSYRVFLSSPSKHGERVSAIQYQVRTIIVISSVWWRQTCPLLSSILTLSSLLYPGQTELHPTLGPEKTDVYCEAKLVVFVHHILQ